MTAKIVIGVLCFIFGSCFGAFLMALYDASSISQNNARQTKQSEEGKK